MNKVQGTIEGTPRDWLRIFLLDRKIQHVSAGSLKFYQQMLEIFVDWCDQEGLTSILQ